MAARASLYTLLDTDTVLKEEIGVEKVYASGDVDTPPERLFLVVRWEEQARAFGNVGPHRVTIWAHTKDLAYDDVDKMLRRIQSILEDALHVPGTDGYILTMATWDGDSGDLQDGAFGTLTRNSGYTILSRYDTHYGEGE